MGTDRRSFMQQAGLLTLAASQSAPLMAQSRTGGLPPPPEPAGGAGERPREVPYRRIATEEAWVPMDVVEAYRRILRDPPPEERGFARMWQRYVTGTGPLLERLLDVGEGRLADMDESGIDVQLLSLTAPGVQVFDADTANALAISSNDQVAEAVARHPDRFAALAAFAPQDPPAAARELERAVTRLGLHGAISNSHTRGEYMDDPKCWEIFEAAEALGAPIYIHPRTPSPAMIDPFMEAGLERGMFGFNVEVAVHVLRIMMSGALDRFPDLKLVIGHAGEGLPYWLYRLDVMYRVGNEAAERLQLTPSEYFRRNVWITTSGVPWAPAITMAQQVLGVDRVLYAMDYPYQFDRREVTMTDDLPISDDDRFMLFETNARRLFGIA